MPSDRARRKSIEAARPQLHPTSQPLAYAIGVGGPSPGRTLGLVLGGAVAVTVALSALTGGFVAPGMVAVVAVFWAVNPPRGLVVTTNGVAVMKRSMLTGKPTEMRLLAPLAALATPVQRSGPWSAYGVGPEEVWLTRKEAALATAAARCLTRH